MQRYRPAPTAIATAIGHDAVELYIPGLAWQGLHALHFMCDPEKVGTACQAVLKRKRKCAVVITASHAESMTGGIEAKQWHNDQVEPACRNHCTGTWNGFGYPIAVELQAVTGMPAAEPQVPVAERVQHWQVAVFVQGRCTCHQRHGINLAIDADVSGHTLGAQESWVLQESTYHQRFGIATGFCRER